MEDATAGLQRRVTARKRGPDRMSKTPKKPRYGTSENPKTVLNTGGGGEEPTDIGWIKNSFVSNQRQVPHCAGGKGTVSNLQNVSKPPKTSGVAHTLMQGSGDRLKDAASRSPSCDRTNNEIFPNLTSTPIQSGSKEVSTLDFPKKNTKVQTFKTDNTGGS